MQNSNAHDAPNQAAPGRWVGGLVGLAACVATALAAAIIGRVVTADDSAGSSDFLGRDGLVMIAIGGLPIAFFGGRALLPAARAGGWLTALGIGFVFGLIAPPLGAVEVVLVATVPLWGSSSGFGENVAGVLFLLPIALVYSYVVVVITIPAGLLWGLMVRAIPQDILVSMDLRN